MPWFAWIAIIAILVWGGLSVFSMVTGRPLPGSDAEGKADPKELEALRKRIEALESGQVKPELERRIDRIEAKVEKREIRDNEHDAWERQAKRLGLDSAGGGEEERDGGTSGSARPRG
ncbi:hypothetical protein ABDK96_05120 [Citricoccus nitrophenolicus]|uniref:SHOCT domain-containing protein n=1 Tax=Citricoccus nitrophenolicus TaxID=863575 RepID=A0ABV0IFX8_9MICC|nr:hypothetical protein [Citricoccus sp. I39-566]WMY78978.1 hypothetical protein RE421_03690 [Citricoccus sp. I39-566]